MLTEKLRERSAGYFAEERRKKLNGWTPAVLNMSKSTCDTLQYIPSPSEVKELHSTSITNCVFNCFLSYTAIMFGIVTIHAIRKTSLSKPLKTLLLSLAASDFGVGLSV